MNWLRRLIPERLRALDLYLQENHPRLWATRIHYHLWFLLLVNALVFALGLSITVTPRHFPDPETLFGFMVLPAVVYFAFWTYRVVLFTVERRFGIRHAFAEVGEFLIHLVSIVLIMSIPYNLALTVAFRAAHLTSDEQFVHEVNTLNEQAQWFFGNDRNYVNERNGEVVTVNTYDIDEEALMQAAQRAADGRPDVGHGTHEFFRSLQEFEQRRAIDEDPMVHEQALHDIYHTTVLAHNEAADPDNGNDPVKAAQLAQELDSIERTFPLYYTQFGHFTPFAYDDELGFTPDSVLEERYIIAQRSKLPPDGKAIEEAQVITQKYNAGVRPISAAQVLTHFHERKETKVGLSGAQDQIRRVEEAKVLRYWIVKPEFLAYAVLLVCFGLTLLISIFKNLYWQPFLITLVVAALLPIVILIFALLTEHTALFPTRDENIMFWCYYLIMLYVVAMLFRIPYLNAYRTRNAVMAILANIALPAFAVFTLFMLDEMFDVFGTRALSRAMSGTVGLEHDRLMLMYQEKRDLFGLCLQIALWGGMVFYVVALHPLMRNLYTRLMALPERK